MENLRNRIKRFEGFRPEIYKDHRGNWTGLWGHNFTAKGIPKGIINYYGSASVFTSMSKDLGEEILSIDLKDCFMDLFQIFGKDKFGFNNFTDERFQNIELIVNESTFEYEVIAVLVDMIFNMGKTRFLSFKKFIAAVKEKNYLRAAKEIKWVDGQKQEMFSRYYEQIDLVCLHLEELNKKNIFHRAEENIIFMYKAAALY